MGRHTGQTKTNKLNNNLILQPLPPHTEVETQAALKSTDTVVPGGQGGAAVEPGCRRTEVHPVGPRTKAEPDGAKGALGLC